MRTKGTKEAVKLLAATLANFSIAGFTLGIYQQDTLGLVTGCYSLACTGSCMEGRRMMWIIMIGIITVVGGIGLWLTRKHS